MNVKWTLRLVLVFTVVAAMLSAQGIREPISANTERRNSTGSVVSILKSAAKDLEMARNHASQGAAGAQMGDNSYSSPQMGDNSYSRPQMGDNSESRPQVGYKNPATMRCNELLKSAVTKLDQASRNGDHFQKQEIARIAAHIGKIRFSLLQSDLAYAWKAIDKALTDVNRLVYRSVVNESRTSVAGSQEIPEPISTNTGRRNSSGSAANAGLASSLQKAAQSLEMARNLTSNDSDSAKKRIVGLLNEAGTVLFNAKRGAAAYQASEIDSLLKQITEARALVLSGKNSAAAWKMIDRIINSVKKLAYKAVTYE